MLPRIEYSVVARTSPAELWAAFCDLSRLLNRDLYTEAQWIQGRPWQPGSRLRYTLEKPIPAEISSVITSVEPPYRVSIINHSLGITGDQIVTFNQLADGTTRVTMTVEFVGQSDVLPEPRVVEMIQFLTEDALDSMLLRWKQSLLTG